MADDFTYEALTDEQRKEQAGAFAASFESERWGHQMALQRLIATPDALRDEGWDEQIAATQRAIDQLDVAIAEQRSIQASL